MTKKIHLFSALSVIVAFIFGTALLSQSGLTANNTGAPSMRTGSPGDTKSCTTCHIGTAQTVSGIISSNVPPTGYIPGMTYIIEAICTDASRTRFGFEISPQNPAGAKLGVLTITDAARTKLVGSGKYVTHTAAGTSGTGTISWSFNWTAPPAGTGDVTFYGAFNFTNHNNASSGDLIKLSQLTVTEDLTTWAEAVPAKEEIKLFPNPAMDRVQLVLPHTTQPGPIRIFGIDGSLVQSMEDYSSEKNKDLDLSSLSAGTYYVSFATEKGMFTYKLIKL